MWRYIVIFLLFSAVLFASETTRPIQHAVVEPWTYLLTRMSGWLMRLGDTNVATDGQLIVNLATGYGVTIEAGCNGIEASIVLIAAILAFPSRPIRKLMGIGVGVLAVQGLNLVRIVSLFYLGEWNTTAFEWAHLYIWQSLIMLDVLIIFLLWMRWQSRISQDSVIPHETPPA
ncbi:exosortase H [Methylococcus mesophilus]|uniref:exosortase H n=1 Tax=Methylococcus mesophilus TaxID=2993564 RepID=UPI003742FAEE